MWKLLLRVLPALNAGQELKNVAGWKNVQATANALVAVLGLVVALVQMIWPEVVYFTEEQILAAAGWIATGLAGLNGYLTVATTKKIGVKSNG
jgi:uncharacterized membrane protein